MSADAESSDYDLRVQDILSKLRFLSKIERHEKLDVSSLSLITDTWYNNLYRFAKWAAATVAESQGFSWCNIESRKASLEFIYQTTEEALNLARELFTKDASATLNYSLGSMIIATLRELDTGIQGLKKTYESDRMFISRIEAFQEILNAQINEVSALAKPSDDKLEKSEEPFVRKSTTIFGHSPKESFSQVKDHTSWMDNDSGEELSKKSGADDEY